jgi:hypothetical protein
MTEAEAVHELQRIALNLEQRDASRYNCVLIDEEANVPAPRDAIPTLADLIAYHRALEEDPRGGGRGVLSIPVMGPGQPIQARVHQDTLSLTARGLQHAEIRYQIEDEAAQRGFCEVGEFNFRTAEAIRGRLVNVRGLTVAAVDVLPLSEVLDFLRELVEEGPGDREVTTEWLTVSRAATASGCERWRISRAADEGELRTNGERGHRRRIDPASLCEWMIRRAEEPRQETDAQVLAAGRGRSRQTPRN